MPTIPRLNQSQINTIGASTARFRAPEIQRGDIQGLGQVANALGDVGKAVLFVKQEEQEKVYQTELQKAGEALLSNEMKARNNMRNYRGENVDKVDYNGKPVSVDQYAVESLKSDMDKYFVDNKVPDTVKNKFNETFIRRTLELQADATKYAVAERDAYQTEVFKSSYTAALNAVANDLSLADRVVNSDITELIKQEATKRGWSDELYNQKLKVAQADVRAIQLTELAQTNPVTAYELLAKYKEAKIFDAQDLARLEPEIETNYYTQNIIAMPEAERKKALDSIGSKDVRERVGKEIKAYEINQRQDMDKQADVLIDKYDKVFNSGSALPKRSSFIKQIEKELPSVNQVEERRMILNMYDAEENRRDMLYRRAQAGAEKKQKQTADEKEIYDVDVLDKAQSFIFKNNITDTAQAVALARQGLIPGHLVKEVRELIKDNALDPSIGTYAKDIVNTNKTIFKDTAEREAFERKFANQVREAQRISGKKLTADEMRGVGERLTKTYKNDRMFSFWSDKDPFYDAVGKDVRYKAKTNVKQEMINYINDPKGAIATKYGKPKGASFNPTLNMFTFTVDGQVYGMDFSNNVMKLKQVIK